jgi:hypothetical protein
MKKLSIITVSLLSVFFFSCKKDAVLLGTNTPNTHLKLTFTNVANVPVQNPSNVSQWNAFFETSTNAVDTFKSVNISGNVIELVGATKLNVKTNTFYRFKYLVKVEDDSTINQLNDFAFANCFGLTYFSSNSLVKTGTQSFQGIISFKTFVAPNATELGSSTFDFNSNLDSVNIANVKTIRQGCFGFCSSLKNVLIPKANTIEDYSFINNNALKYLDISSCVSLGGIDNLVFNGVNGQNITIKLPATLNNNPNILDLKSNNIVTSIN